MKKNFLVVGGTNGLGLSISDKLCFGNNIVTLIGRKNKKNLNTNSNFLSLNLENTSRKEFLSLISDKDGFDGVCFAQRYRPEEGIEDYIKETVPKYLIVRTGWNVGFVPNSRCVISLTYNSILGQKA